MRPRTDELIRRVRDGIEQGEVSASRPPRPPLRAHEALTSLARRLPIDPRGEIRSHRPIVGPAIVAGKRLLRRLVLSVLEPYLRRENELLRELVRYEIEIAARLEELAERETRRRRERDDEEERS